MPNDYPLTPPKNANKHLDKRMISPPTDFRHLAHVGPKTEKEIEMIKSSPNVIDAANECHYYERPSSSTSASLSVRSGQKKERLGLDSAFPIDPNFDPEKFGSVRSYENKPSSHLYENISPTSGRPSTKKYKAPPPPLPPNRSLKPKLIFNDINDVEEPPPVVFRSRSAESEQEVRSMEAEEAPKIGTAQRIKPPKQNSVVLERPGLLNMNFGSPMHLGLDDVIPVTRMSSPLRTESPIFKPIPKRVPVEANHLEIETPILSSTSPENPYMSTIRSTSAQGKEILDELDDFLDQLDESEKEQLSAISTDESGYPTLASAKDRNFMKHLVTKYELNVEPQTIRVRRFKKDRQAPPIPRSVTPNYETLRAIPPFGGDRPVSMPVPNRPPPSYDAPSFDAPNYEPANTLRNGRAMTKQNALDLRSTVSTSDDSVPAALARYLNEKEMKRLGKNATISSGFTEYSTTSSRLSNSQLSDVLSNVGEEEEESRLEKEKEIEQIPLSSVDMAMAPPPVPLPRTKRMISTLREEVESPTIEVEEKVTIICEELELNLENRAKEMVEEKENRNEMKDDVRKTIIMDPIIPEEILGIEDEADEKEEEGEEDDEVLVTRF